MSCPGRPLARFVLSAAMVKPTFRGTTLVHAAVNPIRASRIHSLSSLPFDPSRGVPPLLSPKAIDVIYNQHQAQVLSALNAYLSQIKNAEGRSLYDIIMVTNNKPDLAHVFNTASQSWNNDFFLQHLSAEEVPMNPLFEKRIAREWGSLENFKEDFKNHALGIFGCGWTWLVRDSYDNVRIINTFNAGSPHIPRYKPAFGKMRLTPGAPIPEKLEYDRYSPMLCVSVWEQAYVPDYGVNGREQYLDNFWKAVDWTKVARNLSNDCTVTVQAMA